MLYFGFKNPFSMQETYYRLPIDKSFCPNQRHILMPGENEKKENTISISSFYIHRNLGPNLPALNGLNKT